MLTTSKNKNLLLFYALGLMIHGAVFFFTFQETYDAYVHLFFADHYAENWFETWNPKWYTGFNITSYPPLVHQGIAILSMVAGLKLAFVIWALGVIILFIRGVYHFSALFVPEPAMKYVGLLAVFSFSFTEALHVFGQLPSLTGVSILLNACPFIYKWFREKKMRDFVTALSLLALTTCAHHVTTIFGMVFFVLPVIALALMDNLMVQQDKRVTIGQFIKAIYQQIIPAGTFGLAVITITIFVILPYWLWSKSDPITQIPIPHGSRENFIAEPNLGIVFFLIPWGMMLFALPYIFQKFFSRRLVFFGLSFTLLFILGTGGTTPIPRMILGNTAYDILTLDRFTFWATVMALPMWGWFLYDLIEGQLAQYWIKKDRTWIVRTLSIFLISGTLLLTAVTINLSNFKPMQPDQIDMVPIVNFLERDNHDKWRYLTLGFGDQVAWLSANTDAQTVDGNYHSVRRLPELTSRAVERLENAKYLGMEGLGALQQFLTIPHNFYLKYIFSNDKFYEPILYFTGWKRTGSLENDIVVWERPDVPFLPTLLPRKDIPRYQKMIWGLAPMSVLLTVVFIYLFFFKRSNHPFFCPRDRLLPPSLFLSGVRPRITLAWCLGLTVLIFGTGMINAYQNHQQISPGNTVRTYFEAIDFKNFQEAYQLFVPGSFPDFERYILELSLSDGILASYAKLDSLALKVESLAHDRARILAQAQWITSLETYSSEHTIHLTKHGPLWYIEPFEKDPSIPAQRFQRQPAVSYKSQGRRSFNVPANEDILDRPELLIEEAHLVALENSYHVIGVLRNIDVDPAHVTVQAVLYDTLGIELGRYGLRDIGIHALQPKEATPFRIDFDRDGWAQSSLRITKDTATIHPASFALFVNTVVTDEEIYRNIGLENMLCRDEQIITGTLVNYGTKEITIPQIIFSHSSNGQLRWVDRFYLESGLRPGRELDFSQTLDSLPEIRHTHRAPPSALIVNGISMKEQVNQQTMPSQSYEFEYCESGRLSFKVNAFVNEINR